VFSSITTQKLFLVYLCWAQDPLAPFSTVALEFDGKAEDKIFINETAFVARSYIQSHLGAPKNVNGWFTKATTIIQNNYIPPPTTGSLPV
jgi:hypothetical protein